MAGSHIVKPEYIFRRPNPVFEDIKLFVNMASDTIQEDLQIYGQLRQMGQFVKHGCCLYWFRKFPYIHSSQYK